MLERTPQSEELVRHWISWREASGRDVPGRAALKPYHLPELIPDITLGFVHTAGIKVLLAGSHITERIGVEIAGRDYMEFISSSQQAAVLQVVQLVCDFPVGVCVQMTSAYQRGYTLALEVTLLPLCGETGAVDHVIALSVPDREKHSVPQSSFRGDPVEADWNGPIGWIDLGCGVPAQSPTGLTQKAAP